MLSWRQLAEYGVNWVQRQAQRRRPQRPQQQEGQEGQEQQQQQGGPAGGVAPYRPDFKSSTVKHYLLHAGGRAGGRAGAGRRAAAML